MEIFVDIYFWVTSNLDILYGYFLKQITTPVCVL